MRKGRVWALVKASVSAWVDDNASSMGAALAYYTVFSIAPLVVILVAVAGLVFGADAAEGQLMEQLRGSMGEAGAKAVQDLLTSVKDPASSGIAAVLGVVTLLFGATTVFAELQSALNRIWRAPEVDTGGGLRGWLRTRLLAFAMVLGMGFLLLVSLILSAVLAAVGSWWGQQFQGQEVLLNLVNVVASFAIVTLLFALTYKFIPRVKIAWQDVWIGAAVTALLFTLGKLLLGLYIGRMVRASAYGAAGSLVVLLAWVYYSAQIFLLGAEFTWVYAYRHGSRAGQAGAVKSEPPQ